MKTGRYAVSLSCPDRPGIVAAVSGVLFASAANIVEAQQFDDSETGRFFCRIAFKLDGDGPDGVARIEAALQPIAARFGMDWSVRDLDQRPRVLIMVSKFDHCLSDLLYRWRIGEMHMDIVGIIANHPREVYSHHDFGGIPFWHLPAAPGQKAEQEAEMWRIITSLNTDLVVLARYMQILSDELSQKLAGRCINIHHSFLPSFKGAKPYHQAHLRGVKLIGATAHYVTGDLDEGSIIEQDVERVSHHDTPEMLVRKGRDIERRVLARAVSWHLDGRVMQNGVKTVVFRD